MGVDYIARKSAKKRKKKERQAVGKDGVAARERRRKKIRRLCQGVCYKPPVITEEDKHWSDNEDGNAGALDSDVEEAAARANSHRGTSTSGGGEAGDAAKKPAAAKKQPKKRKLNDDADGKKAADGGAGMSTAVKLLDPAVLAHNARQAALKKLPPGAKADALEAFPPLVQACMLSQHHVEPTPVQERCWSPALAARDVQGVAEPGSGKTLAYLLPGLVRLQVAAQCRALRAVTGLRTVCVFGGAPREEQAALLVAKPPHVLVGTPGRLLDLVDGGELKLQGHVRYLVLDEADKMLSLGFKPQLDRLYALLLEPHDSANGGADAAKPGASKGKKKAAAAEVEAAAGGAGGRPQVLLFSATMPPEVSAAAGQWLRRPEMVRVSADGANAISRTVTQVVHVCAEHKKPDKLLKHLARVKESTPAGARNPPRLLVFANRVKTVRFLATTLAKEGHKVAQLHGQRSQAERAQAVSDFKSGKAQVLVATDVAARGLHINALPYVVNYDFPSRLETYVHRVGRTGRLAAYGHAYSFFTRNLAPLAPPLLELLKTHDQAVDPNLAALAAAWKVAEQKLGDAGAAAAAAAIRLKEEGPGSGGGEDDDEAEDDDDDEGDAAAAAAEREEGRISMAEQVLSAADDLTEGLGLRDARAIAELVRKKLTKKEQKQLPQQGGDDAEVEAGAGAAPAVKKQRKGREGDAQLVPTTREQQRAQEKQQQPGGEGRQVSFVPSKSFTGGKPGYAFKKGPQGLGYYLDPVQQKAAAGAATGGRGKAAAAGKGSKGGAVPTTAGAAVKPGSAAAKPGVAAAKPSAAAKPKGAANDAAAWGLPSRNKPIIPVRHSDFLSDDDDSDDGHSDGGGSSGPGSDSDPESEAAPAPVRQAGKPAAAAAAQRGPPEEDSAGGESSGEDRGGDSDEEDESGRAAAKRKNKSLPGRLRKKLAKERGKGQGSQRGGGAPQRAGGPGRGQQAQASFVQDSGLRPTAKG
ncbi:hypothetical protein GPECTOR_7g1311 [Gonium pectorale]|uniref:RNA helicase n=1 Tax=Gonium pectorale TaxID=33097 RepID=A0A150GUI7_GONPE|nr:hypothetical protein GPECTOR_7g1311 [Gonium pectorale]|eukprot:KXZ53413.1 hypothetical protein GPECTOR_7g1311 [Gonium pectorale]